jgi:NAD+ dependent glucose-6-phosphate dehydrogenase
MDGLAGDYDVHGVDRNRRGRPPGVRKLDLSNARRAQAAFQGVDTVVDLAAYPVAEAPWEMVYENNVPATMNVLGAAHEAGARRVVFASSCHVAQLYERDEPYAAIVDGRYDGLDPHAIPRLRGDVPARPDGFYGIAKVMGEAAGRWYAEEHGLSVICLRLGTVSRDDRPGWSRHFATLLSHADCVRLVRACIEAPPELGYAIYFGVSANTWRFWDIEQPREEIGYDPQDDAERWR